ncbi:hypothetical protein LCGC14_1491390 [marine sediment metagenome]|uniref:RecA family profile 2 domain-containing protein n=1 Tax=marine sediment metagenome TaxID=412755 RepID=A0A0F9M8D8_9ZZZZ
MPPQTINGESVQSLANWTAGWNKKAGRKVVFDPEDKILIPEGIHLGIPAVDNMLGDGFPRGRTTIFLGEASSGKTLLAQLLIAAAQKEGGTCMFFDIERTFDPRWFKATGVDINSDKFIVARPRNLEETFEMVIDALEKVRPDVIVVDSIPALVPRAIMETRMEKERMGLTAKRISDGVKLCTQTNQDCVLVFINQPRISLGVTFGNPETMPGGKQLLFSSTILVRTRRGAWILEDDDEKENMDGDTKKEKNRAGFILKLRTERNKIFRPFEDSTLEFRFDGSIDWISSLVHDALVAGTITSPSKGYFESGLWEGKIHGREKVETMIRKDKELKDELTRRTGNSK